jgi:two-component system, NtrC family, sensor kinase
MNLVNNATDALLDHKVADAHISISVVVTSTVVSIVIRDNGPGIPEDIMETLFEPFVTKQKAGGTGLGLAIVKQYITAHGGDIKVENNKGAVFTIGLPVVE